MKAFVEFSRWGQRFAAIILLLIFSFVPACQKKDNMAKLSKKLADAVNKGYLAQVQKLVQEHPKLTNFPGEDEMASTPLHVAVDHGRFEIAKFGKWRRHQRAQ